MLGDREWYLFAGDNRVLMANMGDDTVDAVVTDGPYELVSIRKRFGPGCAPQQFGTDGAYARAARGFMGQTWDGTGIVNDPAFWAEVLRVLKPGGWLISFGGTRTYHRMACAVEDAGFEIRDMLEWLYGSGFPKGSVVDGWGPALKPGHEPICMARKPFKGSIADCRARWGTGALNIDGCRVPSDEVTGWGGAQGGSADPSQSQGRNYRMAAGQARPVTGRFPANVLHDGSWDVLAGFPAQAGGGFGKRGGQRRDENDYGFGATMETVGYGDSGSAARFFGSFKHDEEDICARANIAAMRFDLQNHLDDFAARVAATGACREGRPSWFIPIAHSMSATATELSNLDEMLIWATQGIVSALWHAPLHERLILSRSNVEFVASKTPTGIIMTMTGLTISSGCVEPVIFNIMQPNWEAGEPGYGQSSVKYCAKASNRDRDEGCDKLPPMPAGMASENSGQHLTRRDEGYEVAQRANGHPTVKPVALMQWLVRLVTPARGIVFDPFTGSGSTGKAAMLEGFRFVGAEMTPEYVPIAEARIAWALEQRNLTARS